MFLGIEVETGQVCECFGGMLLHMYRGGPLRIGMELPLPGCRSSISLWTKRHYVRLQEKDHSPETLGGPLHPRAAFAKRSSWTATVMTDG